MITNIVVAYVLHFLSCAREQEPRISPSIRHCEQRHCVLQYWGKRRGIYSNVMGFLGGVNFAILVARVCMHYPLACGAAIVRSFFKLYMHWPWSAQNPIQICGVDTGGPVANMVWDIQLAMLQGKEIFPIITPCYPASNSTFNVSVRSALLTSS